ncbi:MAG: DUF2147 domain-containing protein [Deltaproteobacteria bacterium]|nr:DUF2147 domain-containing protein [Deltaproteobacteria bacterium]
MKKGIVWFGMIGVLMFATSVFAADSNAVTGKWWDENKGSQIEVYKCADKYCGKVIYLAEPNFGEKDKGGMAGKPKVDRENPNPAHRNIPILGLNMMSGFKYAGGNVWEDGKIYNAEDGKTYKCKLTLENPDRLKVRGFIGVSLLGKTQYWSRVK